MSKNPGNTGLMRIFRAGINSYHGFLIAFKDEAAFRQELLILAIFTPIALWLDVSALEKVILIVALFFILLVEVLNSAIEACIDRVGPEIHPQSKKAKDLGSLAVSLALGMAAAVWLAILL
ncbi:Diacylglycerol kinase [Sinobacterium norvegicum]|uniref:Diacylglycerol kinase n=1 Tax=Sinobacterium norvegicum TaxID=1641715 RepID=A0ABM9AEY5_9GAMM|nr:diacylglycerol kinase [Sinobacterium norvegicum]CAH0991595.1 Diacylglycerol kinase [Sinobacterium norvegicum]